MRKNIIVLLGFVLILDGCGHEDNSIKSNRIISQLNSHNSIKVQQIVIPSDTLKRTVEIYTTIWVFNSPLSYDFDLYYYRRDSIKFEDIKQKKQESLDWAIKKRDSLNNVFNIGYDFTKEVEVWNKKKTANQIE